VRTLAAAITGCGLTNAGAATEDEFGCEGLHGRPRTFGPRRRRRREWQGDEYRLWLRGRMRQYAVFGEDFELTRRARLGDAAFATEDTVRIAPTGHGR
jgi:hypothetical protein